MCWTIRLRYRRKRSHGMKQLRWVKVLPALWRRECTYFLLGYMSIQTHCMQVVEQHSHCSQTVEQSNGRWWNCSLLQRNRNIRVILSSHHCLLYTHSFSRQLRRNIHSVWLIDWQHACADPNIVSLYGYCQKDSFLCLVCEYVPGGNLSEAVIGKSLDPTLKIDIALSVCSGMIFLHSKNVIHRGTPVNMSRALHSVDLKLANVLVENLEQAKVKICDFGLARLKTSNSSIVNVYGTPAYAGNHPLTPSLTCMWHC